MRKIQEIIASTEEYYGLPQGSIYDHCRTATVSRARHVAAYLVRTTTDHSYPEISDEFHKHHTTIMHSVKTVKENYKHYRDDIKNILPSRIII